MEKYYFFSDDLSVLGKMIKRLSTEIKRLGEEQREVAMQSTENFGHDDACQEVITYERKIILSKIKDLSEIAAKATVIKDTISADTNRIRIGKTVELNNSQIFRIGSYMVLANHPVRNISYNSPLARALLGKKKGDEIKFRGKLFKITNIE